MFSKRVKISDEEQLKIYMKCSKEEIAKMLLQCNKHCKLKGCRELKVVKE